jgi:DMSO reductase anchor subunit
VQSNRARGHHGDVAAAPPDRLLFGFWLGAMLTGIASGLVVVFALKGTGAEHTTRHTAGQVGWLVFVTVLVVIGFIAAGVSFGQILNASIGISTRRFCNLSR